MLCLSPIKFVFATTALIPALSTSLNCSASECIVNKIIGTLMGRFLISRAACNPFMRGIAKSKITRSGPICGAFSTASTPSTASPHTSSPNSRSRNCRRLARIAPQSSAIKMHLDNGVSNLQVTAVNSPLHPKYANVQIASRE